MIAAALLLAAQSISGDGANLAPASEAAIVAGAKACIGATTADTAGLDARLAGWTDATGAQKAGMKTDGRVVTRDNVMLVAKPGIDGGCVVQAKAAAGFDKAAFYADMSAAAGVAIAADGKTPVTMLSNGEILIVQAGEDNGETGVQIVVANQKGKHAHMQGNGPK